MASVESRNLDGWTTLWLAMAALWSLGLVAAGFFVTSYSSTNGPGLTLVQENGTGVLVPLLIPFVAVAIIAFALWRRRRLRLPGVGVLAWIVFGLLTLLVVLGALTVGPFIAPIAVFLAVAITRGRGEPIGREPMTH